MNKYNYIEKSIAALMFIIFISVIVLFSIFIPDKKFSESENRVLQQFPKFSLERLAKGRFTKEYEKYISDQMAFRDLWIGIKTSTEKALGKKDNNGVFLGKNGQLMQDFKRPESEDVKRKAENIKQFTSAVPDVSTYFMLVPDSVKILEEKLPPFATPADQLEYINKLKDILQDDVEFVDVYDVLSSKKDEYIYYRTDHHWTTKGAYYAYSKLARTMGINPRDKGDFTIKQVTDNFYGSLYSKSGFRNLKSDSIDVFIPKQNKRVWIWYYDKSEGSNSPYVVDNLKKKDKYTVFMDGNHSLVKLTTNNGNDRKLLIIKDSFANCFIPFLTEHFSEIYAVDLRYYNDSLKSFIKSKGIDDVLILYSVNTFFEDSSIENINW